MIDLPDNIYKILLKKYRLDSPLLSQKEKEDLALFYLKSKHTPEEIKRRVMVRHFSEKIKRNRIYGSVNRRSYRYDKNYRDKKNWGI